MSKKRKSTDTSSVASKRMKDDSSIEEDKFQRLIFEIGYQSAQQMIANSYLRLTFNTYVNPLIKHVIYSYYCQVNLYILYLSQIFVITIYSY